MSTLLSGHYLRNRSTLDIGVLGYIGIVQHKEHSPEVLSLLGHPVYIYIYISYIHAIRTLTAYLNRAAQCLSFFPQNAVYFIILSVFIHIISMCYIKGAPNFECPRNGC